MLRGGSWNNNARDLRVSNRNRNEPGNRNNNIGFRCVRDMGRVAQAISRPEPRRLRPLRVCQPSFPDRRPDAVGCPLRRINKTPRPCGSVSEARPGRGRLQ